jgi:hypothetical protein
LIQTKVQTLEGGQAKYSNNGRGMYDNALFPIAFHMQPNEHKVGTEIRRTPAFVRCSTVTIQKKSSNSTIN